MKTYYNSKMLDFNVYENTILGFQKVIGDPNKVFMWVKGQVKRPDNQSKIRRLSNNALLSSEIEWGKEILDIELVKRHLSRQLRGVGITEKDFIRLQDDSLADKWITNDGSERNFMKALIKKPKSERNGEYLNIQIKQTITIPKALKDRAMIESAGNTSKYLSILKKLLHKSTVRRYVPYARKFGNKMIASRSLEACFVTYNNKRYRVFETSELVFNKPEHRFINLEYPIISGGVSNSIVFEPINLSIDFNSEEEEILNMQRVAKTHKISSKAR